MKTVKLLGVVLLLASVASCGQSGKVAPKGVQAAFTKKFPNAQKVKWELENKTEWEAEFKLEGKEYSANFKSDGTWKETEHEILESEIPTAVKNTIDKQFADYDLVESEISETTKGKVYELELEKGETVVEVSISTQGKVVKKEMKKEKDED